MISSLTKRRRYGQFGSTPSIGARWLPSLGVAATPVDIAGVIRNVLFDLPERNFVFDLPVRSLEYDLV